MFFCKSENKANAKRGVKRRRSASHHQFRRKRQVQGSQIGSEMDRGPCPGLYHIRTLCSVNPESFTLPVELVGGSYLFTDTFPRGGARLHVAQTLDLIRERRHCEHVQVHSSYFNPRPVSYNYSGLCSDTRSSLSRSRMSSLLPLLCIMK